jgi:hypothetical protein
MIQVEKMQNLENKKDAGCSKKQREFVTTQQQKSKVASFWKKYPNGVGEIIDMRAVLR